MPSEGSPRSLPRLMWGAVGEVGIVKGAGDKGAFKDILGAGDDLDGGFFPYIHLADLQFVCIGVFFDL